MSKKSNPSYSEFLSYFPSIDLPITISSESRIEFSKVNKPFSMAILDEFVIPYIDDDIDEFTEFIPCLQLADCIEFDAVLIWKGGLMRYEYILLTIDKTGTLISKKTIAGLRSDNVTILQSVATIDEDWLIHIMVGEQLINKITYDPERSQAMTMEILANGDIIFSLQD